MQYALVDGIKSSAEPKLKAICEHCNSPVVAKCGSKVVWHWAHQAIENCDAWHEPETQWHRDWKNSFGKIFSEISIVKEGIRHIADVLTADNLVIEFQNSPISAETIAARENFYEKMIWVINGAHFKNNFAIRDKDFLDNWDLPTQIVQHDKLLMSEPGARLLTVKEQWIKQPEIKSILTRLKFVYDAGQNIYYYDLINLQNALTIEGRLQGGILELYRAQKIAKKFQPICYRWSPQRISWQDATKPVFIDLNEEYLILIKTNIGNKSGEGIKVSKKDFLDKYKAANSVTT